MEKEEIVSSNNTSKFFWSVGVLRQSEKQPLTQVKNVKAQMPNQIPMSNDKKERVIGFWIWDFDISLTFGFWHLALIRCDFAKIHFFDPIILLL
jgi:hypothetical protein